jgi:transposase
MPRPYSNDLRARVIEAIEAGASRREVAERYELSASVVVLWAQRFEQTGSVAAKPSGGSTSPLEEHADFLLTLIVKRPDLTLDEIVAAMAKRSSLSNRDLAHVAAFVGEPDRRHRRLLRASGERPRRRTANQRDEIAPPREAEHLLEREHGDGGAELTAAESVSTSGIGAAHASSVSAPAARWLSSRRRGHPRCGRPR